ncbi:hypothetical protein A8E62_32800 [Burkholderia cenocepacia]|uniref:Uncharacterized protein n=1 Tax=Burkholderia cenocepacia TaxID=95486 RepID=A0A1V2VQV2_9BURK|nr:hypothetical protein A8E66_31065 [Burkholderia cenocepacia]ONU47324.1 hypothetical protein A8E62_32800 [Burkholderia cenocepacia]ONU52251.1 hypothetical protein A8E67_33615 [Burkholderia cenocepacia]ONU54725.1 hypothetical protein A8E68_34330 [Burkholderia cenocepacia]ONU72823.1 hypothetical protein A8E72_41125 [Burkholderia cenocepacia]
MQLPKTAKNRNLETVRIRVLPPVLLAPLRRPSPAPLRRPATPAPHVIVRRARRSSMVARKAHSPAVTANRLR